MKRDKPPKGTAYGDLLALCKQIKKYNKKYPGLQFRLTLDDTPKSKTNPGA